MSHTTNDKSTSPSRDLVIQQLLRPLQVFLDDETIRELTIPRPGLLLVRQHGAWHPHELPDLSFGHLHSLVSAIVSYNRTGHSPIMSLLMPGGERAQVALPPAVIDGTISLNIRKHSTFVKTLDELSAQGALQDWVDVSGPAGDPDCMSRQDIELMRLKLDKDMHAFLSKAVAYRRNIIIAGKTGSGKTTFARSLIELVPASERLITIEDVHELFLPNHPNRVHMIYGSIEGRVSATECIAAAMRSSPDRIFLSELRGVEAWDYLNALNTGHPGSVTTTHANSARDTYDRIALLIKQSAAGNQIDVQTIRQFLYSTLDIALYFADYKLAEVYFNPGRSIQ